MEPTKGTHMHENLPLQELRKLWMQHWSLSPHKGIGRSMMAKSIEHKINEKNGGGFTPEQQIRLDPLIRQYKRNPKCFKGAHAPLKPGTRLMRTFKGKRHSVLVKSSGFEYNKKSYSSLSHIASEITGSRWNGWVFFGLKKV